MSLIKVLGEPQYACSNLFVADCDGNRLVYPAPYHLEVRLGDDSQKSDEIELAVNSYFESIFMVEYFFSLFFFVLGYDGTLSSYIFDNVTKKEEVRSESYGYRCTFLFNRMFIHKNVSEIDYYDQLQKLKQQTRIPNPLR